MAEYDADERVAVDMVLDLFGFAICLQAETWVQPTRSSAAVHVRPCVPWSWCAAKCVIVCHARVVRVGEFGFGCVFDVLVQTCAW